MKSAHKWALGILIVPFVLLGILIALASFGGAGSTQALGSNDCSSVPGAITGPPSPIADDAVPSNLMPIYREAEKRYHVPWNWLAAINRVETQFGQNLNVSSAGAIGWMQFMPATWKKYGVDANGDGRKDPYDPEDAIFGAANYLHASGAPQDMHRAVFAYNHAEWYYQEVRGFALKYSLTSPLGAPVDFGGSCALANSGVPGKVSIFAGPPPANLPGKPITPETMAYLAKVAGIYGKELVVTTGTNHDQFTVDGNVSDHWDGHAADIGMVANGGADDSPVGDAIMTACLIAAGFDSRTAEASAKQGGLYTIPRSPEGLRVQCIWKTYEGGNHHNHVHIGARPA